MAKTGQQTWEGRSGNQYEFEVYTSDTTFNDVSAVYIFARYNTQERTWTPLYIGESGELGTRIANHEKWPCVRRHGVTHIHVHQVIGASNRMEIETDLINRWSPVCND